MINGFDKKRKLGAIILAAGKGKRMNSKNRNKVVLMVGKKPMILYSIELLEKMRINPILVVVGFAKRSVMEVLKNEVVFVEQKKRLGTGHAVLCALKNVPENITDLLVFQGDDSAFYKEETISQLINKHLASDSAMTFLTIEKENPFGLGRIVRDERGNLISIVEEKDATLKEKEIKEINPACYVFKTDFLKKYLGKIKKSKVTGEYYLTSLIHLAIENHVPIETFKAGKLLWRGINTKDELIEAEHLFKEIH